MITPQMTESKLEDRLLYKFVNKKLLHNALIHRSYLNENLSETESNERLEFLGDAILEFVVSKELYTRFKIEDEGHLTTLRAKLVDKKSLSSTALELEIGQAVYLSKGEDLGKGRQNAGLLADTVEAIIGAIYLDQGIDEVTKFINKFILSKIPDIVKSSLKDSKSLLQEYVQASGLPSPVYRVIEETGPDHNKMFMVEVIINRASYAEGTGNSKHIATQVAATNALEKWSK